MAITEEEANRLISTILESIPETASQPGGVGVSDFVDQWRAEVEAGRPFERKLTVKQSPGLDQLSGTPRSRTSSTGEFVGKKEYTKVEQLDLLIEALGLAFVAPQEMAAVFLGTIERIHSNDPAVGIRPISISLAAAGDEEPTLHFDYEAISQSREAAEPLVKLLQELSNEGGLRKRNLDAREEAI